MSRLKEDVGLHSHVIPCGCDSYVSNLPFIHMGSIARPFGFMVSFSSFGAMVLQFWVVPVAGPLLPRILLFFFQKQPPK